MSQSNISQCPGNENAATAEAASGTSAQLTDVVQQFLLDANDAVEAGQADKAIHILKQGMRQNSFKAYSAIEASEEWLERAHQCTPESIMMLLKIGQVLTRSGHRDESIAELGRIMKRQQSMRKVHLLVEVLLQLQAFDETIDLLGQLVERNPTRMDAMFELAVVFRRAGRVDMAVKWFESILKQADYAPACNELGCLYANAGRFSKAIEYLRRAIELCPEKEAEVGINISNIMMQIGRIHEGIELLRKAMEAMPPDIRRLANSNLLLNLHYEPVLDPQMLFDEHRRWARTYAPLSKAGTSYNNVVDPDRRLRVGYISPDFRRHSVAYFFEPLLDERDREQVEVYGYGNVSSPDQFSERLKGKFNYYQNVYGVSDEEVIGMIGQDQIDILVDLAGHTACNRLGVLIVKPAPIQVTYLGYPNTTGMEAVDYRLTDRLADTPQSQRFYTEELFFLPDGFLCYRPPDFAPAVAPPPAIKNGFITFGSFNSSRKINPKVIELWAQILKANDKFRLLLKFRGGREREVKDNYFVRFKQLGIAPERVKILGQMDPAAHLRLYEQVDIALDTYPYHGTTTTCEALWMGVPVITLVGQCHASRVGLSLLGRLGLEFFVTSSPAEYVAKATVLAGKAEALSRIRASMRNRMAVSTLCDAKKFVGHVEVAYRKMWRRWCSSQSSKIVSAELSHDLR